MKKMIVTLLFAAFAMFLVACGGTTAAPEEAAVAPVEEAVVEETAEEVVEEPVEEVVEEVAEEPAEEVAEEAAEEVAEEPAEEVAAGELTYVINTADSSVVWTGAKAVGDSHSGTIDISEGALVVENGALVSGSFVLDMATINNTDLSGGMKDRIEGHLKSDDFFGVEQFPEATVVITSAEANGDGTYNVVADLMIKGITNPIEFVATASEDGAAFTAAADLVFDRAIYDVRYGSGTFFSGLGNDLINDEVEISVTLVANS